MNYGWHLHKYMYIKIKTENKKCVTHSKSSTIVKIYSISYCKINRNERKVNKIRRQPDKRMNVQMI